MLENRENRSTNIAYISILDRLKRVCKDLRKKCIEHPKNDPIKTVLLSFLTKSNHSLDAIILLYKRSLFHEAQSLIRIIFELYVTFLAFDRLLRGSPREAAVRVWDSVMLEKIKQQKMSDFKELDMIPGAPSPQDLLNQEVEIAKRYSDLELKKLKRHDFSGLNVEQRALQAGLSDEYNIVYRNFSRNVHSTDFMELTLFQNPEIVKIVPYEDYTDSRDYIGCEITFISVFGVDSVINSIFQLNFDRRLMNIQKKRNELHDLNKT
jgi:hypothetical protein